MKYDVIIVGAGPAGIFTAMELVKNNSTKNILLVEKGKAIEDRSCPKSKTKKCVSCNPCNITTGFSGAGAFSDGKLSLSYEVGGDFPMLVGADFAQELIHYTDKIYLEFGADTHIEGVSEPAKVREIRKRAIHAGLKLVDCPIRHLGTEKAQHIYGAIEKYLVDKGVEMLFGYLRDMYGEKEEHPFTFRFEPGYICGELDLLKSVLLNLADNACKASEPGKPIEVFGENRPEGYYFTVKDYGVGISPEDCRRITEAFYMVDKSRSRSHNGAGLGLALCAEILKLHGSRLEIRSTLGKGSTFAFVIPYPAEADGGAAESHVRQTEDIR